MKANIHPTYYSDAKVSCVCGNSFTTGSTSPSTRVEICSKCHPFYTGAQKLNDTRGQVEKYTKIKAASEAKIAERAKILENRSSKKVQKSADRPSLKDLLTQARKQASS